MFDEIVRLTIYTGTAKFALLTFVKYPVFHVFAPKRLMAEFNNPAKLPSDCFAGHSVV